MLLDDSSQINSITPAYTKAHDLVVGLLEELASNPTGHPIQGIKGVCTGAIGYMVFRVQIEGIPSYNEEQVALVVDNESAFARKVLIILGTPTLHHVVNCMKESEMEKAPLSGRMSTWVMKYTTDSTHTMPTWNWMNHFLRTLDRILQILTRW